MHQEILTDFKSLETGVQSNCQFDISMNAKQPVRENTQYNY
jgi:hypothetical protein